MFQCCESELDDLYWKYSYHELKKRISLYVGHATASQMAQFTSLVAVLSAAVGGKKDKPVPQDLTQMDPALMVAQINRLGAI